MTPADLSRKTALLALIGAALAGCGVNATPVTEPSEQIPITGPDYRPRQARRPRCRSATIAARCPVWPPSSAWNGGSRTPWYSHERAINDG